MKSGQGTTTISIRVSKITLNKLRLLGIKPSSVMAKALSDAIELEVRRAAMSNLQSRVKKLKPLLDEITTAEVVKTIREPRDSRPRALSSIPSFMPTLKNAEKEEEG